MKRKLLVTILLAMLSQTLSSPYATGASTNPSPICVASICTVSFPFTGDTYAWTVPSNTTYTLEVWGAQGGSAGYNGTIYTAGAKGGYAKGLISLTSGEILNIYVGGQGFGETYTTTSTYVPGGFNGGGNGYIGNLVNDRRGAGGGGGTDIRVGGNSLSNRAIVGGGGGGGTYYTGYGTNYPGVGGGLAGGDGATANYNATYSYNGKGGTQSAGGALGSNGTAGTAGTSGQGGTGSNYVVGSGGGGGGYWGGGGSGGGMGSGGGSGFVGLLSTTVLTAGDSSMPNPDGGTMTGRSGNGYARISYTAPAATISMSLAGGVTRVVRGQSIAITATIDFAGKVTFFADGKRISGCISMQSSVGSKVCYWKPTVQKSVLLSVKFEPSGASVTTASLPNIAVVKRTGTR